MKSALPGLMLMVLLTGSTEVAVGEPFFLMTQSVPRSSVGGSIVRMDPRTYSKFRIRHTSTLYRPMCVDYDPVENEIYWSEVGLYRRIRKSSLNGGFAQTVMDGLSPFSSEIGGLAIDSTDRLLFYADSYHNLIGRMNLDSSYSHIPIVSSGLERPRAIVLDTNAKMLYWTDWGTEAKIERAQYDGSYRTTLINSRLIFINALALDIPNDRMYWVDAGTDRVEMSNLNGNNRQILLHAASKYHFFGMTLYGGALYITDWGEDGSSTTSSKLIKVTVYGDGEIVATQSYGRLNDIHVYSVSSSQSMAQGSWTLATVIVMARIIIS